MNVFDKLDRLLKSRYELIQANDEQRQEIEQNLVYMMVDRILKPSTFSRLTMQMDIIHALFPVLQSLDSSSDDLELAELIKSVEKYIG